MNGDKLIIHNKDIGEVVPMFNQVPYHEDRSCA
jgi:hypothetical protein